MSFTPKLHVSKKCRRLVPMALFSFSKRKAFVAISDWSDDRTNDTCISDRIGLPLREITEGLCRSTLFSLRISHEGTLWVTGKQSAEESIRENTGDFGSICFVIRRPGCGLCRENGWALNLLTMMPGNPLDGFGIFGVVKETGVDDGGLSDFHSYFPYPLYRDDDKAFYKAFGFRKVQMNVRNPMSATSKALRVVLRLKQKKIKTNFRGEGFIQGGIIFFGPDLRPMYLYEENTGEEISVQDILDVVDTMRTRFSVNL